MPVKKKKKWIIAAKAQSSAFGVSKHWQFALDSDVNAIINQGFWTGMKKFIKGQLPYIVTKVLADKLEMLSKLLERVLGIKRLDKHDLAHSEKKNAANAAKQVEPEKNQESNAAAALIEEKSTYKVEKVTGVVKRPLANDVFYMGDKLNVVWDHSLLRGDGLQGTDTVTLNRKTNDQAKVDAAFAAESSQNKRGGLKRQGKLESSEIGNFKCDTNFQILLNRKSDDETFGKWEIPVLDVQLPYDDPDDHLCGDSSRICNRVEIDLLSQKDFESLEPGTYYVRTSCIISERYQTTSSDENEFEIRADEVVAPTIDHCHESVMLTFGVFPFKYPLGIEWDLRKCTKVLTSKMKNLMSTFGKEGGEDKIDREGTSGDIEFEAKPNSDAGEAATARTAEVDPSDGDTAEMETSLQQLDSARDNSEYGIGVMQTSATEDDGCSSLNIFGGVEVDLSVIEMALMSASSFHRGLKAAVAVVGAAVVSEQDFQNDQARAYTPTKRELQLDLIHAGYLLSQQDARKDELFELVSEVEDDVPLTPAQVATLKMSDTLLMLIISDKQYEAYFAKQQAEKNQVGMMAKDVGLNALKFYYIMESAEKISKFLESNGLGMNIHGR